MFNSLWAHGLQHTRLLCPSLSPGVCSNSCPLSPWCYLTISSVTPFSFCLQPFPASGSFPMSWLFPSVGQSIRASASVSVLPVNESLGVISSTLIFWRVLRVGNLRHLPLKVRTTGPWWGVPGSSPEWQGCFWTQTVSTLRLSEEEKPDSVGKCSLNA